VPDDLQGRVVLITGANSGIGRATAEALAVRGAQVVMAGRSEEKTRPVLDEIRAAHPGAAVEFLPLDLASFASVRAAAATFLASGRPLDVLINNAGLAGTRRLTAEGFDMTYGTNHIGPFLLTSLLLPALQSAPQGRVVNVASDAHRGVKHMEWSGLDRRTEPARSGWRAYALTKLMNVLHARALAHRLGDTRVTTYSLHPGVIASNIWRSVPWPIRPLMTLFMQSNSEGARTPVYCATAPELAAISGRYYDHEHDVRPSALGADDALAEELWVRTEAAIAGTGA